MVFLLYNNNVLLQKYYMVQPLQTASSATDEQLISSTVIQEIRLHQGETEREKKSLKTEEQRKEDSYNTSLPHPWTWMEHGPRM